MKKYTSLLVVLASLTMALVGCFKPSPDAAARPKFCDLGVVEVSDGIQSRHDLGGGRVCVIAPTIQKDGIILLSMRIEESGKLLQTLKAKTRSDMAFQMSVGDIGVGLTPHIKLAADDKTAVLPERHMSESQIAEIAGRELSGIQSFSCQFTNGVWDILEIQTGTWVSSATTNADGHIFVNSTHPAQLVLRVSDADGKVERIKTP
jgi:hypothetical protein